MFGKFQGWKTALFDLIAPPGCAGCGVIGVPYCMRCLSETRLSQDECCIICGTAGNKESLCPRCALLPPVFKQARSFARYSRPFQGVVLTLKHQGDRSLGDFISQKVRGSLRAQRWPVQLGVPVPLGKERHRARGYNQVDLFAAGLARDLGIGYAPGALTRVVETRSQVGLSHLERRYNLRKAFDADPGRVSGKNVLLFDDVFTSGTTANECAAALLEAGAGEVYVYTLARAESVSWPEKT